MIWRATTLGELVRIEHGFAFKGEFFTGSGRQIVLTPGNFHEEGGFRARPGKDRYYAGEFPERYVLERHALIVAMTEQGEGLLGSAALVPDPETYLHNQRIGRVKERRELADRRFLYYLLNTDHVRQQIRNSSSGTKVRHSSPERMYSAAVEVPDVALQRKIAGILSAYDDLIANNQRRIALLESMAEEIYREWFVRMRFPGHESAKSEKGLPRGWRDVELQAVAKVNANSITRRLAPEWIEYLDISAVTTNAMSQPESTRIDDAPGRARRMAKHGDVIWSTVRPANRAYALVLDPAENLIVSTGFAVISPRPGAPYTYLHQAVTTSNFVEQMVAVAKGSAYPATGFDDFAKARIIWPSDDLLRRFHALAEPMALETGVLRKQSVHLSKLRDALLPRLISGKLKVDHLDIQLPPSMREKVTG